MPSGVRDHLAATCLVFSPRRSFWTLFKRNDTRQAYSGYEILDFLRSLSVLWLICLHQQNQWLLQSYFDKPEFSKEEVLWWNGFVWSGHFSVDLFLLISGFLIGMIILKEQQKTNKRLDLCRFYIRRLLRIYPLLLVNFGVYFYAETTLIQGSYQCRDNWWATLFFVNNIPQIIHYSDTCMLWTWSLALEMQFYLIISLILAATPNNIKIHKIICWGVLIGSVILRLVISINIGATFPPVISEFGGDNRWSFELYIPPYTRIGNLFIGVLAAIYEMEAKGEASKSVSSLKPQDSNDVIKISVSSVWKALWLVVRLLCISIVIAFPLVNWSAVLDSQCEFTQDCGCDKYSVKMMIENPDLNTCEKPIEDCDVYLRLSDKCGNVWLPYGIQIFFLATYRTIFCGAYGILVYHVLIESKQRREQGVGPTCYVRFFSWSIWFFIAQISYGMYLWNQMIIYIVQLLFFEHIFEDGRNITFGWKALVLLTCIVFTIAMSIVTYILVEKPFMDIRDYEKFLTTVKANRKLKVTEDDTEESSPDGNETTQNKTSVAAA